MNSDNPPAETRCGFVTIIGAPNAGKSTLLNALVGEKVSIVSPKVQTTRMRVRGIMMRDSSQVVLVDTPGIFKPRGRLDRAMVAAAWDGEQDADITALIIDASRPDARKHVEDIVRRLKQHHGENGKPTILILNKVDLLPYVNFDMDRASRFARSINKDIEIFPLSATTGQGLEAWYAWLRRERAKKSR